MEERAVAGVVYPAFEGFWAYDLKYIQNISLESSTFLTCSRALEKIARILGSWPLEQTKINEQVLTGFLCSSRILPQDAAHFSDTD